MTKRQEKQVDNIMQTLHSQRFYDFYKDGGEWDNYIGGFIEDKKARDKQKKEMKEKIKLMFGVE